MADLALDDIAEKMRDIDFAILSTRTQSGAIAARPMSNNRQVEYDGDNFFFTLQDTGSIRDITGDPNVGLSFQGRSGALARIASRLRAPRPSRSRRARRRYARRLR